MMKAKLKNAPHLGEQKNDGAELLILIGSKAWNAWDNGVYWHKPYAPTRKKNL